MSSWGDSNLLIASRLDRPASTQAAMKAKQAERDELLNAVEIFLAKGGTIQRIPAHVSKEAQLGQMRTGQIETISMKDIAARWDLSIRAVPAVLGKWPTLMYVMDGQERLYSLDDIKRCEQQPNYRYNKSMI